MISLVFSVFVTQLKFGFFVSLMDCSSDLVRRIFMQILPPVSFRFHPAT